ncbi:ATP-binding protein [Methylovulum psychrotolerans]|uniref:ATP-binding protein n=1 Tax=Methylovulum psychrotolerans TaxID=1704499 RepID=A0A1Z4BV08_9GAMM|nr:ATP-binding protein [Methylovulum psychrotolerans]ASF45049.1 hypothetical protein CEK71_02635 [Methylovulum psychrotolerans]
MNKIIGKIAATEKSPTTIEEFFFWTDKERVLHPFDVVKVDHLRNSFTFGVIEEISHITDAASYLTSYVSNDFGDVTHAPNMHRIGMNFVKARVVGNTNNIYNPVLDGRNVSLASIKEIQTALGLDNIKNPLPCGYLEMYESEDKVTLPVHFNSHFLIGPEGAHLNISGISGLAAKTSYAMFLLKAIQQNYLTNKDIDKNESIAFVLFNVKGRDLLAIDEPNQDLNGADKDIYKMLGVTAEPFENVKYFYPYTKNHQSEHANTYAHPKDVLYQIDENKALKYKYIYEQDKESLELLFSNIEDSTGTMDSIVNYIITEQGEFNGLRCWSDFKDKINEYCQKQSGKNSEITANSWRKFKRVVNKALNNDFFAPRITKDSNETRLEEAIENIQKNDILVVDIAKLSEDMQAFVFGDVIRAIYELKLGQLSDRADEEIPSKIIIFVDELNKYASSDVPKNSPILKQVLDITERGRSLGIILFSAEQFKSAIHDRVKGNCATHAYGRTNAIEISKSDYRFIPGVYKGMMTRLEQGEYIIQNPIFRSLLNIKFPKPVYKQFKNG